MNGWQITNNEAEKQKQKHKKKLELSQKFQEN